jgi:cation diffusion facilitator family transporter
MFFAKLFIKDYKDTESPAIREKYGLLSGIVGIIVNLILAVLKFVIGTVTNSVAITADAFNNLTDCLTSVLTILGFRWSNKPADREHPFGHSRIEYLVSLAIAGIILITGYEVIRSSVEIIINPEVIDFTAAAVAILVFSMIVKVFMVFFNRNLGGAIKSETLLAIAIDSRNDVLITAGVLISLVFTQFTGILIDGHVGALLGLVFLRSGYQVAKEALGRIIGNPADTQVSGKIKEIVRAYDGVIGVHDLVVHSYGPGRDMASLHVEVPVDIPFAEAHEIVEKAANEVLEKLRISLVVHMDPIDTSDKRLQDLISLTRGLLKAEYPYLSAHEFRIVNTLPKATFIFDLDIPYEHKKDALALRDGICRHIEKFASGYICDINVEHGYT